MMDGIDRLLKAPDLLAVLRRQVTVRLVEISASGSLLESASRVERGATCTLRVRFEGEEYADDVRVVRWSGTPGASGMYQLGATFLWTSSPGPYSLRRVVNRLGAASIVMGVLEASM